MTASIQKPNQPAAERSGSAGWLMGPKADATFIVGLTALGLLSAGAVIARPSLWGPVLLADLWFLGYHHVISTFTRLAGDTESRRMYRAHLTWIPLAVLAAVVAVGLGVGLWALTTTYFYWQWWHYTRQSWGVNRVYERKAGLDTPTENPKIAQAVFYLLPLWGILSRSASDPDKFLGIDLKAIPVPGLLADAVGVLACAGLAWLVAQRFVAWRAGRLPVAQTLYLASHYLIFSAGYLLIDNIDFGWLAINIWHNAQYVLFVWYFNNQRAQKAQTRGVVPWISKSHRFGIYMVVSVLVSSVVYLTLRETIALVVTPVIVYQTINFHHYVVDSVIWKVRKKPMQETLGLSPTST